MRFLSDIPASVRDILPTEVYVLMQIGAVQLVRLDLTDAAEVAEIDAYCASNGLEQLRIIENDVEPERAYVLLRAAEGLKVPGE